MIWNIISNEERIRIWKKLRNDISDLSLYDQMSAIVFFCSSMPFGARTLDYYNPMGWPTPWEILFYGSFCTSSVSLLIFYTLILLPTEKKVELLLVEDDRCVYLLPIVNDEYILNYELGHINKYDEIKENFKILQTYKKENVKIIT